MTQPPPRDPPAAWRVRDRRIPLGARTLVMGIVNVTPDSFSDGGAFEEADAAVAHALRLVDEGADVLDVGGESTRPGSNPVDPKEEARRVVPVLRALRARTDVPLSVDTRRASVAAAALDAGAHIVNDVSALGDPDMARVAARAAAGLVLVHMKGQPRTMQRAPQYDDVVAEAAAFLQARALRAREAGVDAAAIALDPGLGFGKRTGAGTEDNVELLARLPELARLGHPLLVGASRKRFLANLTNGAPPRDRLEASLAAACAAALGGAAMVRVHDVGATRRALAVVDAVRAARGRTRRP